MGRLDQNQDVDIFHRLRVIMTDPTVIAQMWDVNSKDAERIRQKMAIVQTGLIVIAKDMEQIVIDIGALADKKLSLAEVKSVLPPAETLAAQLELELKSAEVINEMTALIISRIMSVGEGVSQSLLSMGDVVDAQGDQAAAAFRISKASEKFLDENRGVNTLLYNLFVWVMSHVPTIRYVFETVRPDRARIAASQMLKSQAVQLADAIYEGAGVFGRYKEQDDNPPD